MHALTPSQYILAAAMFDEYARVKLLSVSAEWFDDDVKPAIAKIQQLFPAF